ncbi:hypothetical protein Tco_1183385 [Tanacetum coccineum]
MKVKESLNVTFDETPPPPKTSPLEDDELVKEEAIEFWETAFESTPENEEMEITATIDGRLKTITEVSIRRHLKLEDSDGIPTLPNANIFKQLALMGPKKTAWEQFVTPPNLGSSGMLNIRGHYFIDQ